MKRIVIGMAAHVDAGKTTLSEALMFTTGNIRRAGRVDKRDAFLDTHDIEKNRGITVFSKQAVMNYKGNEYTLLDTPGHAELSSETERALGVLDAAVVVISGIDGVQSHTETLWRLLSRYKIPVFIFVNKMDISEFTKEYLLAELKCRLSDRICDFSPSRDRDELFEEISTADEALMNEYLENGSLDDGMIRAAVGKRQIFPCYFGSALKFKGIEELTEGIDRFSPDPEYGEEFGAVVYKITLEGGTRLSHMKITGGSLKVRSLMESGEKVSRIRVYSGAKFSSPEEAFAGTVCAVEGLSATFAGEGLGAEKNSEPPLLEPVLSYRAVFPPEVDAHTMLTWLRQLEEEDPQLHIVWNERLGEIYVRLMGVLRREILQAAVKERFNTDISFDSGSIAYKETIAAPVEGVGHYEPLRHYAEVHLLMEPLERGSGLEFRTDCSEDVLDRNRQRLVLTHLEEKTHIGVLTGSPITDMRITLVAGKAHIKHTEGGDFRQATYRAVRMGLMCAESVLLEPWYEFTLEIPMGCVGRAMNDIQMMSGEFSPPETVGENAVIKGSAPVSRMAEYQAEVTAYTGGKGRLVCVLKGYFSCHNTEEVIDRFAYQPEADLDNSPDSIFCAHGAGFNVRWDEVREHMHVDSGIRFGGEDAPESEQTAPVPDYRARQYDDEELMAIFERTYGKIDRDPRRAMRREYEQNDKPKKAKPLPAGPGYLLVDGYNMIFAWEELKKLAQDDLDLARGKLIDILCNYRGFKQCKLILVFDAYKVKGNHGEIEEINGISVVYTKEAETADMYIEKVTHELARDNRVRVATSDGAEQLIILGNGAYRISAGEFYEEVKAAERAVSEIIAQKTLKNSNAVKRIKHEIKDDKKCRS